MCSVDNSMIDFSYHPSDIPEKCLRKDKYDSLISRNVGICSKCSHFAVVSKSLSMSLTGNFDNVEKQYLCRIDRNSLFGKLEQFENLEIPKSCDYYAEYLVGKLNNADGTNTRTTTKEIEK